MQASAGARKHHFVLADNRKRHTTCQCPRWDKPLPRTLFSPRCMEPAPPTAVRVELHTDWGDGRRVRQCLDDALAQPQATLHLVVLAPTLPLPTTGMASLDAFLRSITQPGVSTHTWSHGRVRLSVWAMDFGTAVQGLRLTAQRIVLGAAPWATGAQALALCKALTRCAQRGTELQVLAPDAAQRAALAPCWSGTGWQAQGDGSHAWAWNPAWTVKTDREPWRAWVRAPGRCAVVGAGIAGAAVAAALAQQGWTVQVLDAAPDLAAGASSLPVGLAAPYTSADDSPLARLTRQGVQCLMDAARPLLIEGQDWAPSGAYELPLGGGGGERRWQPQACWIQPRALVQAWMATPGVHFHPGAAVHAVARDGAHWGLRDARGQTLAQVDRVVLAVAAGLPDILARSPDLLAAGAGRGWPPLHTVRGLVSWARHAQPELRPFPRIPVHGAGSLIAHVPFADGARWFVGASYQPVHGDEAEWPDDKNHGANALRLEALAPELFAALTPELEAGALQAWKGQRCVTGDRMPLLGPLSPALTDVWACAGFGSRGLSLVALCAELLAAQWGGKPWPLPASLAQALLPYRKRL